MTTASGRDYFDRARIVAVGLAAVAGVATVAGSFMTWASAGRPPDEVAGEFALGAFSPPVSGFDAGDGKIVIGAASFMLVGALLLGVTRRSRYGLLVMVASIVSGAVAIAAYRALDDPASDFYRRLDLTGIIDPGPGLILVTAAGLVGVVAGGLGMIASPSDR